MQRETQLKHNLMFISTISILSLYAEGDLLGLYYLGRSLISILSLYAEGDKGAYYTYATFRTISILSLYAEGDYNSIRFRGRSGSHFNPLPLCRGRREPLSSEALGLEYFNPLPLCRGRRVSAWAQKRRWQISILSLYAEGDYRLRPFNQFYGNFNPLPLCRGRHVWRRRFFRI